MSGVIVERRDQVLITGGRCPPARTRSTAFRMPLSMNGPFLTERAICLHCRLLIRCFRIDRLNDGQWQSFESTYLLLRSLQNHLLRALVAARLVTACRLAPGRYRITSAGSLAFTAAVRVIHRVHRHAANLRTQCPSNAMRPALPSETFSCSMLPTWPTVALQTTGTRRTSPDGMRNCA